MGLEWELIKLVREKRISFKAQQIAQKLGKTITETNQNNTCYRHYEYDDPSRLHIEYRRAYRFDTVNKTIGKNLKVDISYEGNTVFHENVEEITCYTPGDWEEKIIALFNSINH